MSDHEWLIGVLNHDFALQGYIGPETTWDNEMNFAMNHGSGEGSIARPVVLQSSRYHHATATPGI